MSSREKTKAMMPSLGATQGSYAFDALQRIHKYVELNGTDEQRERLRRITGGEGPSGAYKPQEHDMFLAEALAR
jgi:hypothetical protein